MKKVVFAFVLVLLGACGDDEGSIPTQRTFANPLRIDDGWEDYGFGDPYVFRHDGAYFLYPSTKDGHAGIRAWRSENLIDWTYQGLVTDDPVSTGAYAPEVIYWNGTFYLYTSPAGQGHYVYTAPSPTGPFVRRTENIGYQIDGSVFIDVDAQPWFSHAFLGIQMFEMNSFLDPGRRRTPIRESFMFAWTEGSMVVRRGPLYFLTYCGNHVFSSGYRIEYLWSDSSPVGPYHEPVNNPIVLETGPAWRGLGHSSTVLGPDLDSHYLVFHNLVGRSAAGPPVRQMNVSRLAFNGSHMFPIGPTTAAMPLPAEPAWSRRYADGESGSLLSPTATGPRFTAELSFVPGAASTDNAIVWGYRSIADHVAFAIDPTNKVAHVRRIASGAIGDVRTAPLYADFDPTVLHTLHIIGDADATSVEIDCIPLFKIDGPAATGKLGFLTTPGGITPSFAAFSHHANGSADHVATYVLPGALEAVHGFDPALASAPSTRDYTRYVDFTGGASLRFDVTVAEPSRLAFDAVVADPGSVRGEIRWNGERLGRFSLGPLPPGEAPDAEWVRRRLLIAELPAQYGSLEIVFDPRSAGKLLRLHAYETMDAPASGVDLHPLERHDFVEFFSVGDHAWSDYEVEARVDFGAIGDTFALLFRVTQESYHPDQVEAAYLGYRLKVEPNGRLAWSRNAYGRDTPLAAAQVDMSAGAIRTLRIALSDGLARVFVDDQLMWRVYDPEGFRAGRLGVAGGGLSDEQLDAALLSWQLRGSAVAPRDARFIQASE